MVGAHPLVAPRRLQMLRQVQRGKCYLCGMVIPDIGEPCRPDVAASRDHIRPRVMGGELGPPNVALAHYGCNNGKHARGPFACELLYGHVNWLILQDMFPDTYGEEAAKLWPIKSKIHKAWRAAGIFYARRADHDAAMAIALREAGYG